MSQSFQSLSTPGVQQLKPYIPGKPIDELERELGITNSIKLASNENPLGPSEKAVAAIRAHCESVNFYPDGGGYKLRKKIAEKFQIDYAGITLGNGSNDILELVARAFLDANTSAVYSEYAFAVYPIVVQAVGAAANIARAFSLEHETMPLGHDPEALLNSIDEKTRVIFIANPNNPTGTWLEPEVMKRLLDDIPGDVIVVLDMAYNEYMDDSLQINIAAWLASYPNLVITGTFSKIYALAGLRIGYALSSPEIADLLNRVRQPFNTSLLAQEAALASLDDEQHIMKSVELNNSGKSYLKGALNEMGLSCLPTMGNFITVNLRRNAQPVYDALLKQGVIVRPVANYNMPEFLRITIGTAEQNKRMIASLQEVLK
ncbi:MAG: histidinol-phosphate transaminase [Gammaproteobacteria bacterium]|nr:histidinol-phosphate transaminase [Gammaproteobacteria bacterium]